MERIIGSSRRLLPYLSTGLISSRFQSTSYANNSRQQNARHSRAHRRANGQRWRINMTSLTVYAMSWTIWKESIRDILGLETVKLDDDPIQAKIKQSWLYMKHGKTKEAEDILHEALHKAKDLKDELAVTRIYGEMASAYLQMNNLEEAEKLYREVLSRLRILHKGHENEPDFIGISLKLAEIFARQGKLDDAETGFRFCTDRQQQVAEIVIKKYVVSRGAVFAVNHPEGPQFTYGADYSDPIALYGMCLEGYAHFLVNEREESRMEESESCINEAIRIAASLYGYYSAHVANLFNNYGAACLLRQRYSEAVKYLEEGTRKASANAECAALLPGYYCNYAEALFHSGDRDKGLEMANKAVKLAKAMVDPRIKQHADQFLADLNADYGRRRKAGH